ncbi:PAS domain-containing protein [Thermoflexibacter ruber]|uniref:histidine kinase n=1 Tax=Thermoflexibacter ruber TaxID=1003 RepID=A0A1I2HXL4_9BACT|nr:PAS domain-containing protein [Thermoflexibacter ruber]SFF34268.1 PAS domain S-box-containing protein [Thermoflexibacter ruber]
MIKNENLLTLQDKYELLEKIMNNISVIIYIMSVETLGMEYMSREVRNLLGYSEQEFINQPDFSLSLYHSEDYPNVAANIRHSMSMKDNELNAFSYRIRHRSGEYRWFESKELVFERDSYGNATKILGFAQDITDKVNYINELEKKNEQLAEIARLNSHEIRRPLANILGLVALFNREDPADEFNIEVLDKMDKSARELDEVIHRIVDNTY